jgi:hypothetical protein
MELLGAKRLGVSVRGLRYGVLNAAIREQGAPARTHPHRRHSAPKA